MEAYTKEQIADMESRAKGFTADYLELTKKYEVDFISYPELVPNNDGMFVTISRMKVIDKKYLPKEDKDKIIKE